MKKGQIEILGFVVIVLLLFFSLIFYFAFSSSDSTNLLAEAEENLEVSNLLSSIKLYTVCEGVQMSDVIRSCVEGGVSCGQPSCEIVREEIPILVSAWGWEESSYMFTINGVLYAPSRECSGDSFADGYTTVGSEVRLTYCTS